MLWIIIAIFSYLCLAFTALGDRYLLAGKPEPKSYTFFTSIPGFLLLFLVPFVGFVLPNPSQLLLLLLFGALAVLAGFLFYTALEKFEASRVIPSIGGFLPIFTWLFSFLFFSGQASLGLVSGLAFLFLVGGSVLISFERGKKISLSSLVFSLSAALCFSLGFVLMKNFYIQMPFWTALIASRLAIAVFGLVFLFSKSSRLEIFHKNTIFQKKTGVIFLATQSIGALAIFFQSWAVALVPIGYLAFINALEGTRYVFLLGLSVMISIKFPRLLEEKFSRPILIQKSIAILLIVIGLIMLSFSLKNG